jgi:hypothetical protein
MNPVFKKLNYKDQQQLHIINSPDSFKKETDEMKDAASIKTTLAGAKSVSFFLAFVTKQQEVNDLTSKVAALLEEDGLLWFAYPKGTSKRYTCEFNRDNGWEELGKHGFEPVRMVAIDEDWSALRFRKAEHIKNMTRSAAISETGKAKLASKKVRKKG